MGVLEFFVENRKTSLVVLVNYYYSQLHNLRVLRSKNLAELGQMSLLLCHVFVDCSLVAPLRDRTNSLLIPKCGKKSGQRSGIHELKLIGCLRSYLLEIDGPILRFTLCTWLWFLQNRVALLLKWLNV